MDTIGKEKWDDEYSVIGGKGQIAYIDYKDDEFVSSNDLNEEDPIVISVPFRLINGMPQSILVGTTSKCAITMKNTTSDPVELWGVNIFCSNPADSFTLSLLEPPSQGFLEAFSIEDRVLQPYETLTIWLSCKPEEIGMHTSILYFDVEDARIERVVFLLAEDKVSQSLAASKSYAKFPRRKQLAADESLSFSHPSRTKEKRSWYKLPEFEIPPSVRVLLENKQLPGFLSKGLTRENYAMYFSTLLIMEELHLENEIRCYDMEGASMRRKGIQLLALKVPGLAEKRPSLVHGDKVYAMLVSGNANEGTCEGYIYRVEADEVFLRFPQELHTSHQNGNLYNIRFAYNRINMRRMYQAVQAAESLEHTVLFPSHPTNRRLIKASPFVPFTSGLNEEQKHSVETILSCSGPPPYVIYGPPGTGKTMTLVEAILQIYTTKDNTRILVCAASNSAADHILEKLTKNSVARIKENEIFRLNATSRPFEDIQQDYIRFCYFEECIFKCPPLKALRLYRIIICTYISSSLLYFGVTRGHFSHIFLDEAGQISEPETMVAISNLFERETVVVLAGDPKQLGPVVHSRDAENFGLGKSFLQRLFEYRCYNNEDEGFVTKLVRNYRCHPAILDLPSKLFYKGELLACKESKSSKYARLDFLPNKEFPIQFIGVQGCDEREGNNPSWFNRIEASKVVELIMKLIDGTDTDESDIGVITPYRQQVLKIKNVLESWDLLDVKVGSVEQFQGQEREVIIVSTVRSTTKHNKFDKTYSLGFLSNPRRFNVAITRAKSLLIIVGNPHVICKDPYWDKLLRLCADNNSYQGCQLHCRDEESISVENLKL